MSLFDLLKERAGTGEDFEEMLRKKKASMDKPQEDQTQRLIDEYEETGDVTREMQSAINRKLGGKVATEGMTSAQMGRMLQGEPVGLPFEKFSDPDVVGKLKGALSSIVDPEDVEKMKKKLSRGLFN